MHYADGAFWRPLFETNMELLQVQVGCPYERCRFCNMYGDGCLASPREEVEADIRELAASGARPTRIFLAGADAMALPQGDLEWTLRRIRELLPSVETMGCFAGVRSVAAKTDEELGELARLGMSLVSIGAETGYDPALAFMGKGFTAADVAEQCSRLDQAGITYALFYVAGMAGRGHCVDAAKATVATFSQVNPQIVMLQTLTPLEGTPLWDDVRDGAFEPAPELEVLREVREFVATYPKRTFLMGQHSTNVLRLQGKLPDQAAEMLPHLDRAIDGLDERDLERFRASLKSV